MINPRKLCVYLIASCCLAQVSLSANAADAFPSKPIRIIVPYTAGATNDALPRVIAPRMAEILGQPVVVENRPGAGGDIGVEYVVRAPADGYTLLMTSNAAVTRVVTNPKPRYDVVKDLRPVMLIGDQPMILVVAKDFSAQNLQQMLGYAKENPTALTYSSPGAGTPHQLAAELLKAHAGVQLLHIPFKGTAPALVETAAGRVTMTWATTASAGPMLEDGRLKTLAVAARSRLPGSPDVPTIAESGIPGLETGFWYGITAPAGTPDDVVQKLYQAMREAVGLVLLLCSGPMKCHSRLRPETVAILSMPSWT